MRATHSVINILIVDDEKKACTNLQNILSEFVDKEINIVGMAYNTQDAEDMVHKLSPDALFLDIEMPNENAFHFLDRMSPFNFEVVFVTAYDEYAVRAFRLNAIDYILKPISIHELQTAVVKLKERVRYKKLVGERYTPFAELSEQLANKAKQHKIILRDGNSTEIADFKDICFIEAQGSYSRIVFFKDKAVKELIMSNPLSEYEELLPDDLFYRIHRSYLINCAHVKQIRKDGSNQVTIDGNFTLPVSRRRHALLLQFLETNNYV